jgi:hypothetical protein
VNLVKGKHNPSNDLAARASQDLKNRNPTFKKGPEQSVLASGSIKNRSKHVRPRRNFVVILG